MKNIQVKLTFTSDTTAAKAQIQSLQQQLSNLAVASQNQPFGMTKNLQEAQQAALSLKVALQNATNVNTGKLDLGKFMQQIKKSGTSLQQYATRLQRLGPEGTKAFNQMAIAISQAERPAFSLTNSLGKLGQTFLNTARWTLTSSIITGIMSAFRSIVDYAKEFDQALNNIRIVTGKTQEQMERFAKSASEAAKELNTTAKEYAEASLIYFQQGLSTKEVLERTEATVKLAKVVGESAETVSEWMTAIWNNFDDGSETLTHYADVLAELGAATASSADEIATGLEKFSAVASTIGLSYEYAASALATVTAETRQSADVVGTALKTIFSRMEGLKLGKVLEDGTTLNQYSETLATVGVNIKDANGALKDMDVILDETGAKWRALSRDEQVALAQGVAGIRQYSQFMALMDNYDIMEKNVERSKDAIGALEQQFGIYGSGVEATSAQMQNALDVLKSKFLDGEGLANIYKVFSEIVEFAGDMVDALGGLPGILTIAANLMFKAFGPSMLAGVQSISATWANTFGTKKSDQFVQQAQTAATGMTIAGAGSSQEATIESSYLKEQGQYQRELFQLKDNISAADKEILNMEAQILTKMKEQAIEAAKIATEKESSARAAADDLIDEIGTNSGMRAVERLESRATILGGMDARTDSLNQTMKYASETIVDSPKDRAVIADRMTADIDSQVKGAKKILDQDIARDASLRAELATNPGQKRADEINAELGSMDLEKSKEAFAKIEASANQAKKGIDNYKKGTGQLDEVTKKAVKTTNKAATAFGEKGVARSVKQVTVEAKKAGKSIQDLDKRTATISKDFREYGKQTTKATTLTKRLTTGFDNLRKRMSSLSGVKIGQFFSGLASAVMNAVMAVQMLGGGLSQFFESFEDGDWSGMLSGIISISMALTSMVAVVGKVTKGIGHLTKAKQADKVASDAGQLENLESAAGENLEAEATEKNTRKTQENTNAENTNNAAGTADTVGDIAGAAGEVVEGEALDQNTQDTNENTGAKIGNAGASVAKNFGSYATWPAAIATIAALGALGIGLAVSTSKKKDDEAEREALEKEREAAKENISQTEETINKNGELVNSYYDLVDTYQKTGKGIEDLIAKGKELAETYDDESIRIAALAGDYDTLTEAIRRARVAELEEQQGSVSTDTITLGEAVIDAAREGRGFSVNAAIVANDHEKMGVATIASKVFSTNLNDGYVAEMKAGDSTSDETVIYDAINQVNSPYIKKADNGSVYLGIENMSAADLQAAYDDVTEILTTAKNIDPDAIGDSELAKDLTSWRSKLKEAMENYEQAAALERKIKVEKKVLSTKSKKGQYVSAIDTQAEYDAYREEIKAGLSDEEWEDAKDVLMENAGQFEENAQLTDKFATVSTEAEKIVQEHLRTSSDITKKAIALVASDEYLFNQVANGLVDLEAAIESKREEAGVLSVKTAFEGAGYTADAADTYISLLQTYNHELAETGGLGELVAENMFSLNQGLEKLSETWDKHSNILLTANEQTLEYAIALSEVANGVELLYGFEDKDLGLDFQKVIKNYTHTHASYINELMLGNTDAVKSIGMGIASEFAEAKGLRNEFGDMFHFFANNEYDWGETIDVSQVPLDYINQALQEEKVFAEEIIQMFQFMGMEATITDGKIVSLIKTIDEDAINASFVKKLKEREKSNKKILEDEIDRYHVIKEEIDDINNELDELSKRKERAFGASAIAFSQKELEASEKSLEKQKDYIEQIEGKLSGDKQAIRKYGVSFDNEGRISNYEEVFKARTDEFNRKGAALGWQGEEFDALKEEYEDFKENIEQYEETLNLYQDEQNNLLEQEFDIESKKLDIINQEAEVAAAMREDQIGYIEHMLELLDDPAFDTAERINHLTNQTQSVIEGIDDSRNRLKQVLAFNNTFTSEEIEALMNGQEIDLSGRELTSEQAEALRNYRDQLYEGNISLKEMRQTIQDEILESFNVWNEKLRQQTEQLEHNQSILEGYRNIIDIVGRDTLGISEEIEASMSAAAVNTANTAVKTTKAIYDANVKAYEEALASGAVDQETLDEMAATVRDSQQTFMDSWSSALETAATEFESSVERIMEAYDKAMGNLSEKSEWFEKQETLNDFFLKDYEKTYEISKLNRQINQSIDSNDNVTAQRKLRDIQSQLLAYQQEGKEMSDYDLQYLQKKYDLTLAQNALEDAQNAKSQARLTRDSQGNFGYVYTANQKNIESAQQQYEDKLYAMEQFLDKSQSDLSKQWFELNQQWADEMAALDKNAEDYSQKAADITAYYTKLMNNVSGEMTDMVSYGMDINQEYGTHAAETFNETLLGKMYTDYTTFEELQVGCAEAMQEALGNLNDAHDTFEANVDETMEAAGTSVSDFAKNAQTELGKIITKNTEIENDTAQLVINMGTQFGLVVDAAKKFKDDYSTALDPIITKNTEIANSMNKILEHYSKLTGKDFTNWLEEQKNKTDNSENGNPTNDSFNSGGNIDTNKKDITFNSDPTMYATYRKKKDTESYNSKTGMVTDSATGASYKATSIKSIWNPSTEDVEDFYQINNRMETADTIKNDSSLYSAQDIKNLEEQYRIDYYGNNTYEILQTSTTPQGNTLYRLNNNKWYTKDNLKVLDAHGQFKSGARVRLLTDTPTTANLSLNKAEIKKGTNADYITTYDVNGEKTGTVSKWRGDADVTSSLKDNEIIGYKLTSSGTVIYKLKTPIWRQDYYISREVDEALEFPVDKSTTYWLNQTDLNQILGNEDNYKIYENFALTKFDTGGYTGSWGPEGRMAMLHQKEIVLNAHDTENLLTVVEIVRSITDKLNNNILLASQGLGGMVSAAAVTNNREVLEQNVTIHAEFPNATDHNEIELAFNDLINQASQYVNRR